MKIEKLWKHIESRISDPTRREIYVQALMLVTFLFFGAIVCLLVT